MAADESANIETTSTRFVYENRWMRVREDMIRRRDGSTGIYGVVEKPDFVVIVPVEDDGRVHLVEQYRYPVKGRYWEFPQGSWEREPGVDPITYCTLHKIENLVVIPHDFFCLRVHRLDNNGPSYPPSSPHGIVQP
jgi:hypothetical protein